jgi:radical SAM superfamily enzyme YgiQ (UPF0313 family)
MITGRKGFRVLLLSPPYPHLGGEELFGLSGREDRFPLGLFVIANAIRLEQIADVQIYYQPDHTPKTLEALIRDFAPDMVGIGCFTRTRFACIELSQIIKKVNSDIKIVWGGSHATFLDKQVLDHYSCVDMVIRGYAEGAFLDVIRATLDNGKLKDIAGLTWRDDQNKIYRNCDRSLENDLARELTTNVRDLFIGDLPSWQSRDMISYAMPIETTRGCVYTCTFCSRMGPEDRTVVERGPEQSLRYIKGLFEVFGEQQIYLCDTNFTLKKKRCFEFCEFIRQHPLKFEWTCSTRVDLVNKEILTALKQAGCRKIYYGVDSFCKKILPAIGRHFSPEVAVRNLNLSAECGLEVEGNIIIGFPGETAETISESYSYRRQLDKRIRLVVQPLLVMPGGALYYHAVREGFNEDYWLTDHGNNFPAYTGAMSEKLLSEYCRLLKNPQEYNSKKLKELQEI